jgi:hypothetical protein
MKYSEAATPGQLKKNLPATTGGYFLAAPQKKAPVLHPIEKRYNINPTCFPLSLTMTSKKEDVPAVGVPKLRVEFLARGIDKKNDFCIRQAVEKLGFCLQINALTIAQNRQDSDFLSGDCWLLSFPAFILGSTESHF